MEKRLERLELHDAVRARPLAEAQPKPKAKEELPPLTVVKLKPKAEPAPQISTSVEVVEPAQGVVEELPLSLTGAEERREDSAATDAIFENAVAALKTGNLTGGVMRLQSFAGDNPRHAQADNAWYFAGVGLMGLNDYQDAATSFEKVISDYPAGDAVVDSYLKLAECKMRLGRPAEAREAYEKIIRQYPGTAAAVQAQGRLASLKEDRTARAPDEP